MVQKPTRCWTEVSASALDKNIRTIQKAAGRAALLAVIKADAYGHGAVEMAGLLTARKVTTFCVATIAEAVQLREAGFADAEILLLGSFFREDLPEIVEYKITPTVCDAGHLSELARYARRHDLVIAAQLKVDSGMTRYGFASEQLVAKSQDIFRTPGVNITALYSHLAASGSPDDAGTLEQIATFRRTTDFLELNNIWFGSKHILNSGGILYYRDAALDGVRPGLILYGYYPGKIDREALPLAPALTFNARVVAVKAVLAGARIGYDRTYRAEKALTMALLSVGYADGYPVRFSNNGQVLLGRERCPIVGKVCMDTTMVAVPSGKVKVGDTVRLWGGRELPVEEVAAAAGTIPYELTCQISRRVPRLHVT